MSNRIFQQTQSARLFREAERHLPGGVNSPVRSFRNIGGQPIVAAKAHGCYLWDVDGNRYVDYCLSWGAAILGHIPPQVERAVVERLRDGASFGVTCEQEITLAKLVKEFFPSMDLVRFVSSGTEAVMSAVRLARGFTGRPYILKFDGCYHGHSDALLASAGSGVVDLANASSKGVPSDVVRHTLSIPFNDETALQDVFERFGERIAAVVVEPIPANMGVVLPKHGYLQALRDICTEYESVLIFDEVITGFRVAAGGAQELYGVEPDLTTLGKIVGGGFPAAAYGGKRAIMEQLAPLGAVYQAGTLSGNPVAMAAGIAVLETLQQSGFYESLHAESAAFLDALRPLLHTFPMQINSVGSMFTLFFTEQPVMDFTSAQTINAALFAAFHRRLLETGVYASPAQLEANFISAAHTASVLAATAETIEEALQFTFSEYSSEVFA